MSSFFDTVHCSTSPYLHLLGLPANVGVSLRYVALANPWFQSSKCLLHRGIVQPRRSKNRYVLDYIPPYPYRPVPYVMYVRTMTELKATGLVYMDTGDGQTPSKIRLKPEFDWFLTYQFAELKEHKDLQKEKYPPQKAAPLPIPILLYDSTIRSKVLVVDASLSPEVILRFDSTNSVGSNLEKKGIECHPGMLDVIAQMLISSAVLVPIIPNAIVVKLKGHKIVKAATVLRDTASEGKSRCCITNVCQTLGNKTYKSDPTG